MKQFTPMSARHYLQNLSIQKLFIALDCFKDGSGTLRQTLIHADSYVELMELFLHNSDLSLCSTQAKENICKAMGKQEIAEPELMALLAAAVEFVLSKWL